MMVKYTEEQKTKALSSIVEKGVKKTHDETGISVQTLYKWRNEQAEAADKKPKKLKLQNKDVTKLLNDGDYLEGKVKALEDEVKALREKNAALRKAIATLID